MHFIINKWNIFLISIKFQYFLGTQRADGTWRKEIKIKPGYINPDNVKKYVAPPLVR